MPVSFASYEIARSGMFVNERGLYVTGHNISNATTSGYVRQQAMITAAPYVTENNKFQYGLGADIDQIRQIRHSFLDNMYRQENTTLGYWDSRNKALKDVQAILGEPMGNGMQNILNQFWDSWQELSKAPDSLAVRALVRQRGDALVHDINHIGGQLDKLQNDLNSEIKVRIDEVNDITQKIAKLNIEILRTEVSKDTANDYRDQRNLLIDRLANLVDADVTEMQDGQVDITLGGYFLVTKGICKKLSAEESKPGEFFYVPKLEGTDVEVSVKSGIIKGLLEARGEVLTPSNNIVSNLKERLNTLVNTIVIQVNNLHKSGKTLGNPPLPGDDFFTVMNPTRPMEMGNIKLNDNLISLNNIVASESGATGDNSMAIKISNLRHEPLMISAKGILSADEFYQQIILDVGNSGADAQRIFENQQKLVNSSDAYRQSITGVSMDEEMSNMMKFQYAYSASSRVINVVDEMIETIISRMGLAGR